MIWHLRDGRQVELAFVTPQTGQVQVNATVLVVRVDNGPWHACIDGSMTKARARIDAAQAVVETMEKE